MREEYERLVNGIRKETLLNEIDLPPSNTSFERMEDEGEHALTEQAEGRGGLIWHEEQESLREPVFAKDLRTKTNFDKIQF